MTKLSSFRILFILTTAFTSGWSWDPLGAKAAGRSAEASAAQLSAAIVQATSRLSSTLDKSVAEVGATVKELASSIKEVAKSVSIKIDSGDLANIGQAATQNLKDALIELSNNWDLAINTADLKDFGAEAARQLSQAIQNVNIRLELVIGLDKDALATIKHVSDQLSQTMTKTVEEVGATVRNLASSVAEIAKNVNVRINSGDLINIGDAATRNLKDALDVLSTNWNASITTADLEYLGAEAARHLSEAIQNININLYAEVGPGMVRAIGYMSIAGGIAFSVLFIAILISLRQCRSCTSALFVICLHGCRNCGSQDTENNDDRSKDTQKDLVGTDNSRQELKAFLSNNRNAGNLTKKQNLHKTEENRYADLNTENKRFTTSLADYRDFDLMKNFWEKNPL